MTGGGPYDSDEVVVQFEQGGQSASGARRVVSATLEAWERADLHHVATLLVSELVANVVLHAGTGLELRLRHIGGRIRIEVHDGSPLMPERKHYSATAATGRGLVLVERLALAWGVERTATGKAVWFELDDPPSAVSPGAGGNAALGLEDWADPWDDDPAPRTAARLSVEARVRAPGRSPDAAGRRPRRRRVVCLAGARIPGRLAAPAPTRPVVSSSAAS